MDPNQTPDDGAVFDRDMAGQRDAVREHHAVAQETVVGHMRVRHQQAVGADGRLAAAALGAGINGHVLPHFIAVADHQDRLFPAIFEILRDAANHRAGEDLVVGSHRRAAVDDAVGADRRPVADRHMLADHRVGPDRHPVLEFRLRMDDRGRVHPSCRGGGFAGQRALRDLRSGPHRTS